MPSLGRAALRHATENSRHSRLVPVCALVIAVALVAIVASVLRVQERGRIEASEMAAWTTLVSYATESGPLAGSSSNVTPSCPVSKFGQLDQLSDPVTSAMATMDVPAQVVVDKLLNDGWHGIDQPRVAFSTDSWFFEGSRVISGHDASVSLHVTPALDTARPAGINGEAEYAIALTYALIPRVCANID